MELTRTNIKQIRKEIFQYFSMDAILSKNPSIQLYKHKTLKESIFVINEIRATKQHHYQLLAITVLL